MSRKMFSNNGLTAPTNDALEFLRENGYVVFESVLTTQQCDEAASLLEKHISAQEVSARKYPHVDDGLNLRVWSLLSKTEKLDYIINSNFIDSLMKFVFARQTTHHLYFLSSFQGCVLLPGAARQKMHIDTPCPEPVPTYNLKANTIWCLSDFTEINGSTEVIPGSHRLTTKPLADNFSETQVVKVTAPRGSVIVTLGSLWHRGGENSSQSPRYTLFGSFAASWLREAALEEDICRRLDHARIKRSDTSFLERIGFLHGLPLS